MARKAVMERPKRGHVDKHIPVQLVCVREARRDEPELTERPDRRRDAVVLVARDRSVDERKLGGGVETTKRLAHRDVEFTAVQLAELMRVHRSFRPNSSTEIVESRAERYASGEHRFFKGAADAHDNTTEIEADDARWHLHQRECSDGLLGVSPPAPRCHETKCENDEGGGGGDDRYGTARRVRAAI